MVGERVLSTIERAGGFPEEGKRACFPKRTGKLGERQNLS